MKTQRFTVGQKVKEIAINGVAGDEGIVVKADYIDFNQMFDGEPMVFIDVEQDCGRRGKKVFKCVACKWEVA